MMSEYSDIELVEMFRNPETSHYAFNLIVKKHQRQVYLNARRMVFQHENADDITQNVFIKVWQNLPKFREDAQLATWIYRIGVNETISFLRKQKLQALLRFSDVESQLSEKLLSEDHFSGNEIELTLQKALLTLPTRQRQLFMMRYYDELSYEKIASILGLSVGALKASYHLAVKKIEKYIVRH